MTVGIGYGNFWYVIGYRGKGAAPGHWGKPMWTDFLTALELMPLGSALMQWTGGGWQVLKR